MKFGVREICDVVLRAKTAQKIGDKVFYKNEPVIYFDSLKTSSMEGASTTVYAQGGRGNARLMAWEGERTVTFTMEDALISPVSFSILSGAGLIEGKTGATLKMHTTEITTVSKAFSDHFEVTLKEIPYVEKTDAINGSNKNYNNKEDFIYVMLLDENGNVKSEPYIAAEDKITGKTISIYKTEQSDTNGLGTSDTTTDFPTQSGVTNTRKNNIDNIKEGDPVLVDYYVEKAEGSYQINITPDKFGGNFYLEASTLFRAQNGADMPAEFIIPNCKIQSNFTFTMASSGDPSTFTFTMDAFPDYTRWDKKKKVFAAIQVMDTGETNADLERLGTPHNYDIDNATDDPKSNYETYQEKYVEQ